jgi:hypothetical protein
LIAAPEFVTLLVSMARTVAAGFDEPHAAAVKTIATAKQPSEIFVRCPSIQPSPSLSFGRLTQVYTSREQIQPTNVSVGRMTDHL